jgi:RNA polymerase sigma-70 factor (ECF subfamily)
MTGSQVDASDNALMVRYQRGDVGAYSELVERHLPALYSVLAYELGSEFEAERATLRVWAELAQRAGEFRDNVPFTTWLYQMALGLQPEELSGEGPLERSSGAATLKSDEALRTKLCWLSDLPEEQRTVLLLRQLAHLGAAEIAAVVGTTTQEVKDRLKRALLHLHKVEHERKAHPSSFENPK